VYMSEEVVEEIIEEIVTRKSKRGRPPKAEE
jgi:hypothetical protein